MADNPAGMLCSSRRHHRWAIVLQHIEQFRIVLSNSGCLPPTIQHDFSTRKAERTSRRLSAEPAGRFSASMQAMLRCGLQHSWGALVFQHACLCCLTLASLTRAPCRIGLGCSKSRSVGGWGLQAIVPIVVHRQNRVL